MIFKTISIIIIIDIILGMKELFLLFIDMSHKTNNVVGLNISTPYFHPIYFLYLNMYYKQYFSSFFFKIDSFQPTLATIARCKQHWSRNTSCFSLYCFLYFTRKETILKMFV